MNDLSATLPDLPRSAVLRLALTYAIAVNGMVLTPFLVAAVMRRFGLNEGAATGAVGVEIIGLAVSCAIFPRWIARAAHAFAAIGVVGTVLGQLSSVFVQSVVSMTVARGLTGLFEGMLFVVVAASVAHRASSDKLWGQINLVAGVLNGSILVGVSYVPEAALSRGLFILLAGLVAASIPLVSRVGVHASSVLPARAGQTRGKVPLGLILAIWVVTVLIYGVQASQWAVAGIVGAHSGLSASSIGILLSVSSLLGFAGAAVPAWDGSRRYRLGIILLAQLIMVGSLVSFFGSTGATTYFVSQVTLNTAFFVVIPFLTGMLSEVDPDGSLVSRTVVVTLIGAGVGTVMAGSQFAAFGAARFSYAMCLGIAAAAPFVWLALRGAAAYGSRQMSLTPLDGPPVAATHR